MSLSVLVASDSFKGSASSRTIAELVERGVRRVDPDARVFCLPIADGGEGTIDALLAARSGRLRHLEVRGPLGVPVDARYALLDDGCAVLEAAEAIGIGLSDRSPASALAASSFGLGQLLLDALDQDARRVLVGLGGSATSDGGAGFAKALGARLLDRYGMPVEEGLAGLVRVESLDVSGLDPRLGEVDMELLLDVTNPLVGSAGAVRVFGPQKGLDPRELDRYDGWMSGWGELLHRVCVRDVAAVEGAGAAGALASWRSPTPGRDVASSSFWMPSASTRRLRGLTSSSPAREGWTPSPPAGRRRSAWHVVRRRRASRWSRWWEAAPTSSRPRTRRESTSSFPAPTSHARSRTA